MIARMFLAVLLLVESLSLVDRSVAQDLLWAKHAGTSGGVGIEQGNSVALDPSGNSYVTGRFSGVAVFGPGEINQTTLTSTGNGDIFLGKV